MGLLPDIRGTVARVRTWGLPGVANYAKRAVANAVNRRRLAACARRGTRPVPGLTVVGDLSARVSLSQTLRDFVLNARDAGVPCQTFDTCLVPRIPAADRLPPSPGFDLGRYSHLVMMYRAPLPRAAAPGVERARIAFHESEHGIDRTAPFLRASGDTVIALSDFNFRYFTRAFPRQRVVKLPYPFRPARGAATPRDVLRARFGIAPGDFAVFFNFDFGSYVRKNIPAALEAFARAFGGDRTAKLVFKTKGAAENPRRARDMAARVAAHGLGAQFVHIPQYLPRADVDGLTAACDVYLSLHRAEGFGLGMAEAMAQGVPVVATAWSANTEFCTPDTSWPVPFRLVPIRPGEENPANVEWAEADAADAAAALRDIRANPAATAARTARGRAFMADRYALPRFRTALLAFLSGGTA